MREIKKKPCKVCGAFFKPYMSIDRYCGYECAQYDADEKAKEKERRAEIKAKKPKKKRKSIKPISDKREEELAIYRAVRDPYLTKNPVCEVEGCSNSTTNLHHKGGRVGARVYDESNVMACCSVCHPRRIHDNPKWARIKGYLV